MNKEEFQGKFKELKGKIKEKWGKLTDDEITKINGNVEQLVGKLQQKYGLNKEKAEAEINNLLAAGKTQANTQPSKQQPSKDNREKIKTR